MSEYTVIGPVKTRTLRVIWMLEELGVAYTLRPDAPRSEAVRAVNPLGKVPVLLDGEHVLTDSVAILTYLSDKHQMLTFPPGTPERARQDACTNFVVDEMDLAIWTAAKHVFALPEDRRVADVKPTLKWEFERAQTAFEAFLGDGPYLMGETFTIADIMAAHCGGWAIMARFPITSEAFRAYIDRMRARPAFQRALSAG